MIYDGLMETMWRRGSLIFGEGAAEYAAILGMHFIVHDTEARGHGTDDYLSFSYPQNLWFPF